MGPVGGDGGKDGNGVVVGASSTVDKEDDTEDEERGRQLMAHIVDDTMDGTVGGIVGDGRVELWVKRLL